MAAGSLIPLKQYDVLVEIVSELRKQYPAVKALLAGGGPLQSSLQQRIDAAGLQSTLTLTGKLPYPEVIKKMQRAKLFLHPSLYEGFSGVCLEALAAGASVISFTKPMKNLPDNWHVVNTKEEMITLALKLLNDHTHISPLRDYSIEETALQVGQLYKL
jgi:glycosyltransferase involved in cell wall biosynthesis